MPEEIDPNVTPGTEPVTEPPADPIPWTPPTQEEWTKLQASLQTASGEAAERRKFLKAAGIDHRTGKPLVEPTPAPSVTDPPGGDPEAQLASKVAAATKPVEDRALRAERAALASGLREAGVDPSLLALILPQVSPDDYEIKDDGSVEGLPTIVDKLKAAYPAAFTTKKPATPPTKAGAVPRKDGNTPPAKSHGLEVMRAAGLR